MHDHMPDVAAGSANVTSSDAAARRASLFDAAQAAALAQVERNAARFGRHFPDDATQGQTYRLRQVGGHEAGANVGWTTGFWAGLGWLAHEVSGRHHFLRWAQYHDHGFAQRLARHIDLEHHDLGFLYGPTALAGWRVTGAPHYRDQALAAAEVLRARFLPGAGVFQAWGRLDDASEQGRIIIDTVMNLPLLYWAGAQTGQAHYAAAASAHLERTRALLVRGDGSSAHSCHVDPASGRPLRVTTVQGLAAESCWSRGQAWGIYGMALNHRWAPGLGLLETAQRMADYLLARLPPDRICPWDLALSAQPDAVRDSSASAIAACGLLELAGQLPAGPARDTYRRAALDIVQGLVTRCAAPPRPAGGLLAHGVYSLPCGRGVDEANLWGDYYYLEALARINIGWRSVWEVD
jgi:unsaturated chondroitin disaccharide hydrolase